MVDKRTAHEPSIRIPLIIRSSRLAPKGEKVVSQQVLTVDLAPSLLELCGAKPLENLHGRSFVKLLTRGDAEWRSSWFYHYNYEKQFPYTPNVRAVRTDDWKYIRYPHGDGSPDRHLEELYQLREDPSEARNLAQQPEFAPKIKELRAELERLMSATGLNREKDSMPLDEGIKAALPDAKIR
jgi:N-acetylglucosamine-6-sulfatase